MTCSDKDLPSHLRRQRRHEGEPPLTFGNNGAQRTLGLIFLPGESAFQIWAQNLSWLSHPKDRSKYAYVFISNHPYRAFLLKPSSFQATQIVFLDNTFALLSVWKVPVSDPLMTLNWVSFLNQLWVSHVLVICSVRELFSVLTFPFEFFFVIQSSSVGHLCPPGLHSPLGVLSFLPLRRFD